MSHYGIRVRKPGGKWKRVRTLANRKGTWHKPGAEKVLARLRKKGYRGHIFALEHPVHYPTKTHYSEHFSKAELNCRDGCTPDAAVVRNLTELANNGLEIMREELGPIQINSGHRCWARNEVVGGSRLSRHIHGEAVDIHVPPGRYDEYMDAAMAVGIFRGGGIGDYGGSVIHVDHRPWVARWTTFTR